VASHLNKNKLISSKILFLGLARFTGSQNMLKAGVYSFYKKDNMFKVLKILKNGSGNLMHFTVPEGNNIKQTAEIISKIINIDKKKFIKIANDKNMEGYLMPETYFIYPGIREERIIEMMYSEFKKKITLDMYARARKMNILFKDIVILASIIEKEAVKPEERSIISEVFYNRLKSGMKLQSCATVLYAMGTSKVILTIENTKFNSLYNTYIHFGLPPGPICSPGIESIKAALYPTNSGNLFFVSSGNNHHFFSKNFYGHNKNKQIVKLEQQKSQNKNH
jgi:UPF0755 protein